MLNSENIEYEVRRSARARRMRITVHRDGRVVATVPGRFNFEHNLKLLEKFVEEKKVWITERVQKFLASPLRFVKSGTKKEYRENKAQAEALILQRLSVLNMPYGFKYNRVSIRNQKTRWGSCSRKANLNFNYKLLHLPAEIRDYIIVHELCHLKELNHSKNFWNLVAQTVPNYRELRKGLRLS